MINKKKVTLLEKKKFVPNKIQITEEAKEVLNRFDE